MVSATEIDSISEAGKALEVIFGKPEDNGVVMGGSRNEKQRRVKYWRKPDFEGATDAGWIIAGPEYDTDPPRHKTWIHRGYKELPNTFGMQLTGQPTTTISWEASDAQRKKPTIWLEPFIAAGGLTHVISNTEPYGKPGTYLLPAEQIVAYGLHRRPGIKDIRPDLKEAVDIECPHACINNDKSRKLFSGVNQAAAEASLDQHMAAIHRQSEGARAVGMEVSKQWEMAAQKGDGLDAEKIAQIVAATIVALQQSKVLDVTHPEPKKYPEGTPDATWKRVELMAYQGDNGIPEPPNKMKMTQPMWLEYVLSQIAEDNV